MLTIMLTCWIWACAQPRGQNEPIITLQAKVGERIELQLPAQPGTGYRWELAEALDPSYLALEQETLQEGVAGLDGGSSQQVFVFKALRRGRCQFQLVYRRPFETIVPPTAPRRTYRLRIR